MSNLYEIKANDFISKQDYTGAADYLYNCIFTEGHQTISLFKLLIRSQKNSNQLQEAHATIEKAFKLHGDKLALFIELAELLMEEKNWNKAILTWEEIITDFPEDHPAGVYWRLSSAYLQINDTSTATAKILSGLQKDGTYLPLYRQLINISLLEKNWGETIEYINSSPRGIQSEPAIKNIFNRCEAELSSKIAAKSYKKLRDGEFSTALNIFIEATNISCLEKSKSAWVSAFKALVSLLRDEQYIPIEGHNPTSRLEALPKILVGGTGWSGSGALYDFFREFRNIHPIHGEFSHIESTVGLRSLDRRDQINQNVINFFSKACLGLDVYENSAEFIPVQSARWFSLQDNPLYAEACGILLSRLNRECVDQSDLYDATSEFIDTIVSMNIKDNKTGQYTYLLDNVIHCNGISTLNFLKNYTYFGTFRDPRSQFVANMLENPDFHKDVNTFIKQYRSLRQAYERQLSDVDPDKGNIITVAFEEFVLSEDYRNKLAKDAGLDLTRQQKHSFFDPRVSIKNTLLHQTYENQNEIGKIQEQLPGYIWEA